MEDKYIMKGENINLAELTENDLEINLQWMKDNELRRLIERPNEELTLEKQLMWFNKVRNDPARRVFKIMLGNKQEPQYIGNVNIFGIDYNRLEAEIGIFIGYPEHRAKGYGTEALRLTIKYIWQEIHPCIKIRIKMLKENIAAYRTYKKLGFVECRKEDYNFFCDDEVERIYMVLSPHIPESFGFRFPLAKTFPQMVVCGLSFICNSRCIHCPNAATNFTASIKGRDAFMSWEILKKVAEECAGYHHNLIRVSSCGEVLTHPEAIEMIEYLLDVKQDKNVALTTNGSLLTPDKSERLLKRRIRSIEVSVDAATKETFEKIRIGLDFEKVLFNIKELVRLRNENNYNTKIMVSIIEQEANENELDYIFKFWEEIVDDVLIRKLLSFKGIIKRKKEYSTYLHSTVPCPFLWERVLIDSLGNVRGCVSDIYNTSCVGNIKEHSIEELWQSELFNTWRKLHIQGRREEIPMCKGCIDLEYRSWNYNYFYALDKDVSFKPPF
ncbi:MAG: GNAT family N-acetyltransferase [Candidatus Hydrogenedentota bacterium]